MAYMQIMIKNKIVVDHLLLNNYYIKFIVVILIVIATFQILFS